MAIYTRPVPGTSQTVFLLSHAGRTHTEFPGDEIGGQAPDHQSVRASRVVRFGDCLGADSGSRSESSRWNGVLNCAPNDLRYVPPICALQPLSADLAVGANAFAPEPVGWRRSSRRAWRKSVVPRRVPAEGAGTPQPRARRRTRRKRCDVCDVFDPRRGRERGGVCIKYCSKGCPPVISKNPCGKAIPLQAFTGPG